MMTWVAHIGDRFLGQFDAENQTDALEHARDVFHLYEGEVLQVSPAARWPGPRQVILSRLKAFRNDDQIHEIPLGAVVDVRIEACWDIFKLDKEAAADHMTKHNLVRPGDWAKMYADFN